MMHWTGSNAREHATMRGRDSAVMDASEETEKSGHKESRRDLPGGQTNVVERESEDEAKEKHQNNSRIPRPMMARSGLALPFPHVRPECRGCRDDSARCFSLYAIFFFYLAIFLVDITLEIAQHRLYTEGRSIRGPRRWE